MPRPILRKRTIILILPPRPRLLPEVKENQDLLDPEMKTINQPLRMKSWLQPKDKLKTI